jgi:shikimate kinase
MVLIGMAGSGKSTVGSVLAKNLGFKFIDLDKYIREKDGLTIQEIIDTRGEAELLKIEAQRMQEIDLKHTVVSPGGSLIYESGVMEYLKDKAVIIYLDPAFESIQKRIRNASTRGIVGLKAKSLQEIFLERQPLYARYADITIKPDGKSLSEIVGEIKKRCQELC